MKAIKKTKSKKLLSERVTAMEGDPRGAFATWGRRMAGRTRSIFIVLRHGILSLYSYIRKFVPWRSRTYIQNLRHVRIAGLSSSFLLGLLALAIIIPLYNVTGTEDTEAATGTAIDSSITFTSTRASATVDLTPTSASGTFASSTSGTTDAAFSITTTNSQGYELKIKSTSGTVLKPTTTTSDSDGLSTITTSGITSSSFANNTWGYLPNYYNCNEASGACTTNTTNYYPATTSDVTLRKTTSANTTAHNYTIGLGAKANLTKTSGTYTLGGNKGSLVLTYVANPTAYSISYDKGNVTGTPSNIPTAQSSSVSATSVTLSSTTPTLTGYTFTGWCMGTVSTSSAEVDTCTGTGAKTFAAGGTFGLDRTSTNSVTLHAMWTKASVNVTVNFAGSGVTSVTFANATYGNVTVSASGNTAALKYGVSYTITGTYSSGYEFSSWAATAGSLGSTTNASTTYSTTTGATLTLKGKSSIVYTDFCTKNGIPDSQCLQKMSFSNCPTTATSFTDMRDGNTYKIQKLADGSCWLLDNLAIDLASAQTMINLTADTTNATNAELGYLKNGGGTTSDQYATSGVIYWPSSSDSYSVPLVAVSGNKSGGGTWNVNTTVTSYGSGSGKVGAYYNYCAASAGTYCYGNGTSAGTSSGNATADICPAGWQMPSTTSSNNVAGSYYYLYNTAYSANASNFRTALSTPPSGYFDYGSAAGQGVNGSFWSSTRSSNDSMCRLSVTSSTVNPTANIYRFYGYSVRCVMTPPPTMQDATSSSLAKLMPNVGDTATFVDSRDGESYLIGHLADGKYWMLDNLRLDLVAKKSVLSSSNTNATDTELGYLKNGGGSTSDQYATSGVISWPSSSSSYSVPWVAVSGNINGGGTWDVNTTVTSYGSGSGKVGGYYNYCAASAGTYCYGNGTSYGTSSGNATADICPKGWRMPTGGSSGEYKALYTAYSSNASNFRTALSTPLSGSFIDGSAYDQGSYGRFWSSTWFSNNLMYRLNVSSSNVDPTDLNSRYVGYAVRCVLKPTTVCLPAGTQVTISLDGSTKSIEDIQVGDTVVSYDGRSGEYYLTTVLKTIVHDGDERTTRLSDLTLDDGTILTMTPNHRVLTTEGFKAIERNNSAPLTEADTIITEAGPHSIKTIRTYEVPPTITYNLTVDRKPDDDTEDRLSSTYIANGVVVHNEDDEPDCS